MSDEKEEATKEVPELEGLDINELTIETALNNWEIAAGAFQGTRMQWKILEASIAKVREAALRPLPNRQQRRAKK